MAYISVCEVHGLASQVSREFVLNRDINVFFGGNGSGKTSLLRVLHSALANDLGDLRRVALRSASVMISGVHPIRREFWAEPYDVLRTTPAGFDAPAEPIGTLLTGMTSSRDKGWVSDSRKEGNDRALPHIFLPVSRLYFNEDYSNQKSGFAAWSKPLTEADLDKEYAKAINFLWLRYTRNLGIEVQVAQAAGLRQILYDFLMSDAEVAVREGQFPIVDPSQAYDRLVTFLNRQSHFDRESLDEESFNERMQSDMRLRKVVSDIEFFEQHVDSITRPKSELQRILAQMIKGGKHLRLEDEDIRAFGKSDEEIDLEDLSSGEKQLLRIFIDVLLADGQPIIIDEPELSLHIDWQRKLLGVLQRLAPRSQIIVATHSPEIMADVDESRIIKL